MTLALVNILETSSIVSWLSITDKENQSFRRCLFQPNTILFHATHDRAYEIYVENRVYVDDMEGDSYAQETQAPETSHGDVKEWIGRSSGFLFWATLCEVILPSYMRCLKKRTV